MSFYQLNEDNKKTPEYYKHNQEVLRENAKKKEIETCLKKKRN